MFDAFDENRIGTALKNQLNDKILKMKKGFQTIIDSTVNSMYEMQQQMALFNKLSPDAYSIANLSV